MPRSKAKFYVGQKVAVSVRGLPHARITRFHGSDKVVVLDRPILGRALWHVDDIREPRPLTAKEAGKRGR